MEKTEGDIKLYSAISLGRTKKYKCQDTQYMMSLIRSAHGNKLKVSFIPIS